MQINRRKFLAGTGLSLAASLVSPLRLAHASALSVGGAGEALDWSGVRSLFDLSPDYIHLATFFLASHPRPVREAIERYRRLIDANPLYVDDALFEADHENL